MWKFKRSIASRAALLGGAILLGGLLAWPLPGAAQPKQPHTSAKHSQADGKGAGKDKSLAEQFRDLQAKVAKLEAALKQSHQGKATGPSHTTGKGPGMGMMDHTGMMGGMDGMAGMSGMKGKAAGGTGMGKTDGMSDGMGMMDMDRMDMMGMMGMAPKGAGGMPGTKGMAKMQARAALPGFPGASHIYHVGATDFFLDHPEHITLTARQKERLGRLKEKALLAKATAQRKIDEGEQELWALTGDDEPDARLVEAKVREVEKLRGGQRLAFIRAVGEAAKVLTPEQRQAVLGGAPAKTDKPDPHAGHKP